MNKKGVIMTAILALAAVLLLFGLSAMTDGMIEAHMGQPVVVTASPPPEDDAYVQGIQRLQVDYNSLTS